MIAATAHDRFAAADYARMKSVGMRTAREGVRWHRVETSPGRHDFSSCLPMVRAAHAAGIQVIWDLCHYGWPDDLDVFGPGFVPRFRDYTAAFVRARANETDAPLWVAPVNEISFLSWAGGSRGYINPFRQRRGLMLKRQLVRAAIAACDVVRELDPGARIAHIDPIIHIMADPSRPRERPVAARYSRTQFEVWDMLAGRVAPELGGDERYLDVIGVNYYPRNQWLHKGRTLPFTDPLYRPLRLLLSEVWQRYRRPLFVAETGSEGEERAPWLRYVSAEVAAARAAGTPLEGLCLYPILNHPGWDDDRHCHNGLWDYADAEGHRELHAPLAEELARQQRIFS
jgi:beta-glucosidase/6-phospho-beta-glucosidase/beta-galactosidase